ncbi:hypothetical protein PG993_008485 [Apiospora rasikravindrae]|uniref:Uncharacterized protein n=1 Tax=Apiospora rasikravindrae TaxID=990691 RepID=A0ABR1T0H7_9PEZI
MSFNGSLVPEASEFVPNGAVESTDGDVLLVFLSGNGVVFTQESNDPWYRATRIGGPLEASQSGGTSNAYLTTEAASPLGCVQQYQWCNSEYPIPQGCGPLSGWSDAMAGAYPLFNLTEGDFKVDDIPSSDTERGTRINWAVHVSDTDKLKLFDILQTFGAKALASQTLLTAGVQLGLADDQWQLDVINWWNTALAFHQSIFVETALGLTYRDANFQNLVSPPANDLERQLCQSQLHRLAQDELGYGKWSGCTDMVPVTRPEDRLADLDISDLDYPRLNGDAVERESKPEADSQTETAGSEQASTHAVENVMHNLDIELASCEPHRTSDTEDTLLHLEGCRGLEAQRIPKTPSQTEASSLVITGMTPVTGVLGIESRRRAIGERDVPARQVGNDRLETPK